MQRILLAEANGAIRSILREVLGRAGADVVACRCRDELEAAIHAGLYDVVVADPHLGPDQVDNVLLALHLRSPQTPVLILTAARRLDPLVAMMARGIFIKPYPDLVEVARYALAFAREAALPVEPEAALATLCRAN